MNKSFCIGWVVAAFMCLWACGGGGDVVRQEVDSLNVRAYSVKYQSLEETEKWADRALERSATVGYRDGVHEAWLNKGDVYGLAMRYDSAQWCYEKVLKESNNDLVCSVADVGMMSVCVMRSMSKEFYDYRSDALERFDDVAEADGEMSAHQRWMWNAVQTNFHLVSANYFMTVRQDDDAREEMEWLERNQRLFADDTTLVSTFLFLQSMFSIKEGRTIEAGVDDMQRQLLRLLQMSHRNGNVYFEALAQNRLARLVAQQGVEVKPSRRVFLEELMDADVDDDTRGEDFVLRMAKRAERLAEKYGNDFVRTTALVALSDYYLQSGEDSLALVQMETALSLINRNHRLMNGEDAEMLYVYAEVEGDSVVADGDTALVMVEEPLSTEMRWIADPAIVAVPEWMAMVREQLSVVFGAMGQKAKSDYNHNIYFDILDATRQDLRVVQEEENLKREERMLNVLLWVFVVAVVVLMGALIIYNRRSRREYRKKVEMLSQVTEVCRRLPAVLSEEMEDEEDLDRALCAAVDADVVRLFPQLKGMEWTKNDGAVLKGVDKELFRVLRVFYDWVKQKGVQSLRFAEESRRLESETYVFEKRLEENKRQYVEKLTSMSIVNSITPFLDRALHEVQKLKGGDAPERMRERLLYLSELIEKIDDYNNVLGHWVKIRQGMVTLNVENFALQPLFDTLKRGGKAFDIKGVRLHVEATDSVVKADKALTLFMMNTLLDNARKYTPRGGQVSLSARATDDYVEIAVEDTGHGMTVEDVATLNHAKVYDSSKIGVEGEHAADVKENKGGGFGLMNCKGIIGKYKKTSQMFSVCEFGVESDVGKGSRFFFRLPKGVLKVLACLLWMVVLPVSAQNDVERAGMYADSVYVANVEGRYEDALLYADSAILLLNSHYLKENPMGEQLMRLEGVSMGELAWWKEGFDTDYDLIINLRNEVAIAALSLNRGRLYHYNSEVFTRLYKMTSTDPTLEAYCNDVKMANRNKKTVTILLGMLLLLVAVSYLFLYYRRHQLLVFNLRQFMQLNNHVFTSAEENVSQLLYRELSDMKQVDTVGVMMQSGGNGRKEEWMFAGDTSERGTDEMLMRSAWMQRKEVKSGDGCFHAYPLLMSTVEDEWLAGVMGVRFNGGKLTAEERLMMDLVVQFVSIHVYFSHLKVDEMEELLELKQDERRRIDNEQQKVYVRNQIMDNCLSTLKHETMYYPNRIKQLVDAALASDGTLLDGKAISDIDELLVYYKEIFTILSSCAAKQVETVLFRRTMMSAKMIGEMAMRTFNRWRRKTVGKTAFKVATEKQGLQAQGDRIFLQVLVDNIVSLYFEHCSGGDLRLDFDVSDGFAKFAFTDTAYRYTDEELAQLFYVDGIQYDAKTDTLRGMQYMICRQVIREHDAYAARRGCRIYVENCEESDGSRFVFTLPIV